MSVEEEVISELFKMQDQKYKEFQCKLMPTVDPNTVIGVRSPALRKFAKQFNINPKSTEFMESLPHKYYEENNLHGFLIERIKNYDEAIDKIDKFLPYINNWATCDSISPNVFKKHTDELYIKIKEWISSDYTYTIRFGIGMLMGLFLDDNFKRESPSLVLNIKSDEYYVNMMIAWYFATALAKQYDEVLPIFESHKLSKWTHNKAIQKALESLRVDDEKKKYLRSLKIK